MDNSKYNLTGLEEVLYHILRMTKQKHILLDIRIDNNPEGCAVILAFSAVININSIL